MIQKNILAAIFVLSAGFCMAQQPAPNSKLAPAPAPAQNNPAPATPAPDPNGPVMSFQSTEHDYGTIQQDDNGTYLFIFTNTGKEPLVIKEAHGSCDCTVPKWPHGPVNPGQQDTIRVTYDTKRVGTFMKTVTITSTQKNP